MARLHEHEGKALLAEAGFTIPRGSVAASPAEAREVAEALGGPCVVKIQAWTTGRKAIGGVAIVDSPEAAAAEAERMLGMSVGAFPVEKVLIEELVEIDRELFISLYIDDAARAPRILLSLSGGSGIEERGAGVHRLTCDVRSGVDEAELDAALAESDLEQAIRPKVAEAVRAVFDVAKKHEARSVEINPLAIGRRSALRADEFEVVAADCRMTIDDYAVFRHPDLGIEIARELDHPPTKLERIAYEIEQADHRGTFYFAQLNWVDRHSEPISDWVDRHSEPISDSQEETTTAAALATDASARRADLPLVGFHGAGGGGSMMSMDAITSEGFTIANFTDTSGNPSAAKVYRAARIILSQPGLVGYFGSGSGVASQEQFWSAYGLAKAFWELNLDIPAVIRLGGNSEDRAVEILESVNDLVPATIEGYKKDDPPRMIADRFARLVAGSVREPWKPRRPRVPDYVGADFAFRFEITGGRVWIDTRDWDSTKATVLAHAAELLKDDNGRPALAVSQDEIAGKDSELIACEVECRRAGAPVVFVELDIRGLD